MQLRVPKPLNGWRQFAGEVGIIVVGVLIALGAQQVVEDRYWRAQVADARASLDSQLVESKFASLERIANADCIARQLDFLDEVIAGTRPAENLRIRIGSLRLWSTSTWDAAISSGSVAHMTPETRNAYANLFSFTAALGDLNVKSYEAETNLRTLERHTDLTDVSRDRLARDVANLRSMSAMLKLGAGQWLEGAKPLKLVLEEGADAELKKAKICVMPDGSKVRMGVPVS